MIPEEVVARARERAAAAREAGGYAPLGGFTVVPRDEVGTEQLRAWAVLASEESVTPSTRRGGAAVDRAKRVLLGLLQEHVGELTARQTRLNLHLVAHVADLEARVERLEAGHGG